MKTRNTRTCKKCNEIVTIGQPDPCLGYLFDVAHACCGHGNDRKAFCSGFKNCKPNEPIMQHGVTMKGFWIKRGKEAIDHMNSLKKK